MLFYINRQNKRGLFDNIIKRTLKSAPKLFNTQSLNWSLFNDPF